MHISVNCQSLQKKIVEKSDSLKIKNTKIRKSKILWKKKIDLLQKSQ